MDQDTRWLTRYNEVKSFIESNHRNPSKYYPRRETDGSFPEERKKVDERRGIEGTELKLKTLNDNPYLNKILI